MNNLSTSFPFCCPYKRGFKVSRRGLILLWVLAFGVQGEYPGEGQVATATSSSTTATDGASTNAPSATTSTPTEEDLPYIPTPALGPSGTGTPLPLPKPASTPAHKLPPSLEETAALYAQDKFDEALATVNAVLAKEPKNTNGYILRGAIYTAKQAWDLAEKDYQTALQLDPKNDGVRFDLADLHFQEKQFDTAREAFVQLPKNPDSDIRDVIKYKIYLCDLLAGHDDQASKELDEFNQAGVNASYYYGNAAWNLVHKKPQEAKSWLVSARHIYSERKQAIYSAMLEEMGYLPLPPSLEDN